MRGQAHVAFRDVHTSTQAMRALQGFDFFGKEMVRNTIPQMGVLASVNVHLYYRRYSMPKANQIR